MFRAMLWKEVREQLAILVALLALGSGVIAAATMLGSVTGLDAGVADFRAYTNAGRLAVLSLAVAAGVVIGGTLFAGEKENETLACLEMLPANRMRLWWSKLAAGAVMATFAGATLLAMGTALGALGSGAITVWLLWGMVLVYVAFGWGTFGSTMTQSTLGACAIGLVCAVVIGTPTFGAALLVIRQLTPRRVETVEGIWLELPPLVAMYAVAILPLLLAGLVFTAPDRARHARLSTVVARQETRRRWNTPGYFGSLRALLWLTNKQWLIAAGVGFVLTLITGLIGLHEEIHLVMIWPLTTAVAGVMGGVLAWSDEQNKDTFRFWSERRLPLGRLWMMKVLTSYLQTMGWVLILFTPSLIRQLLADNRLPTFPGALRSGLLGLDASAFLYFLLVWPLFGFAFGHLAGLLFRKTIVAVGVGLLSAAPIAALWLPSLITGGVHHWQLWPVPLLVLLTTRLILRAWSSDRLATRQPLTTLGIVALFCIGWTGFGLLERFREVPVEAEIDDDLRFAETVPQLDFDDGGRQFRQTTGSFRTMVFEEYVARQNDRVPFPTGRLMTRDYLRQLAADRWPEKDLVLLGPWLSDPTMLGIFTNLKDAVKKPLGPIENPRGILTSTLFRDANELIPIVSSLLARGLWTQTTGDASEFVACLEAALYATRCARTMQPRTMWGMAYSAERLAFEAADVWIERLKGRPNEVRRLLAVLQTHDTTCPRDLNQLFLTERMIDRNTLIAVSQWAPKELEAELGTYWQQNSTNTIKQKAAMETELLSFSLAVPWERERLNRVFGLKNSRSQPTDPDIYINSWLAMYFLPERLPRFGDTQLLSDALARLAITQAALTLFAVENGRPAIALDELVPKYLPAVPLDPFDRKPLRYRVSLGERLDMGMKPTTTFPQWPAEGDVLPVTDEERTAFRGAIGGMADADRQLGIAPGIRFDGLLEIDPDALAAVAGGLVQWPFDSLELPAIGAPVGEFPEAEMGPRSRTVCEEWLLGDRIVWRTVEEGQGIVWSIGPDLFDHNATRAAGLGNGYDRPMSGDWLRVVPKITK